ncbi:permease [Orenia metallireducens]|uniref:Permease n=1 Tax=Orenia metallireducens TaxID=1413210 RepID=A0A1C0A9R0_9FIRM|nr:DMT family transporter [Orenia metallireducens]OCL27021.1 permease [Orenia metallireducens]
MLQKENYLPILAGVITSLIFGFSFLFTKRALDYLDTFHLLALRFTFAALLLMVLKALGVIKIDFKGKRLGLLILLGVCQPIVYFICETIGLELTTSSEAGMMIALIPVLVTILGAIFLQEVPDKKQLLFIIISVIGVIFIVVMKGNREVDGNLLGIFTLLGAVFSAAFYNIISRKSSLQFKPIEITYLMMIMGAGVFNSIFIFNHFRERTIANYLTPLTYGDVLFAIFYLGVLSSVLAFFLVNFTLSKLEASRSAVFANLTTIISVIAGVFFRDEPFYWFHLVGGMMILVGVWGTNYYGERRVIIEESNLDH